jgi:hypothetical protein
MKSHGSKVGEKTWAYEVHGIDDNISYLWLQILFSTKKEKYLVGFVLAGSWQSLFMFLSIPII